MFLQALCAKRGPHELKLSEFYVINAFAVKLVCHFLCGKENLSCAKVCLCAWLVTENLVCIHRLAVVSKPLCSRPRWRRTRVLASIMCLRCSNSLLAYWQADFKKRLLCRIHEQISWSQKICLCGWGCSVAWNISFCLSIFLFFFLLKAVYEKPVLDLSPTQISSLASFILSELSSSVEDWCLIKGMPWM